MLTTPTRSVKGFEQNKEEPVIRLNPILEALLTDLVATSARRTGETPERARRAVELAVVSRGIEAVQAEVLWVSRADSRGLMPSSSED
jgi:hypothetical protein